ncbi:MAG TPA: c-type cytochrome [Gemmatimonadales bacterium]|nr:c-type cytochrome [Gemmatimonadales bacterium]
MWATNLKVFGVVIGTLLVYTLVCNKIPQMQSEVPVKLALGPNSTSDELVAAGEKVFNGIGGCTACHGLGTRAPNLLTDEKGAGPIGARCGKREAGKDCKAYLYESLDEPAKFVVSGYQPIMPKITAMVPPEQAWALVAFLESQGGTVDVTGADIAKAAPGAAAPAATGGGGGGGGGAGGGFAGGSTDPKAIIKEAGCTNCHKIAGNGGAIGPDLTHVGSRRDAAAIKKKVSDPASDVTKGFENFAGVMPKNFATMMSPAQLDALANYLASQK